MSAAQKKAAASYRARQIQIQALINPATEPELAAAWAELLERFGGSKKQAIAWAILHAKD